MSKTADTPLERVVALHEGAKAILSDSHHVNLRALDATVRSLRAGAQLRGFAEVSAQMRQWSQELHATVAKVTELSADQVNLHRELLQSSTEALVPRLQQSDRV